MPEQKDVFEKMTEIASVPAFTSVFGNEGGYAEKIAAHKAWLQSIRHERPRTDYPFRIGIYIRYFNQTKYNDYLEYHIKQFSDTLALCPVWELVDFYIDTGSVAPNMESAPEWSRLISDCFEGKVNLIITQKVSNVSRKPAEITLLSRLLAALESPVGIYFISEDIYTLASYYLADLKDKEFLPPPGLELPEPPEERLLTDD